MNTTTAFKAGVAHGGPAIFGAGMAMFAVALVSSAGHGGVPTAAGPAPTVTVTQSPAPATGHTTLPVPAASSPAASSPPSAGATLVAAREPRTQTVSAAEQHPGPGAPSGPSPAPPQRSTASCTGIAAVQLLHRCALTVGGSR